MKTFNDYKTDVFNEFRDAGDVGLLTTADFYAIQHMLEDLRLEIEKLKELKKE